MTFNRQGSYSQIIMFMYKIDIGIFLFGAFIRYTHIPGNGNREVNPI